MSLSITYGWIWNTIPDLAIQFPKAVLAGGSRTDCHDSVYDTLFLALMPTQAIAGLMLTFTPHNAQPLVTHHLTYAYHLTHPYLPSHMTSS